MMVKVGASWIRCRHLLGRGILQAKPENWARRPHSRPRVGANGFAVSTISDSYLRTE